LKEFKTTEVLSEKDRPRKAAMMQYLAQHARLEVLDVLHEKGTGHWGGAASAAELLVSLYFDRMNVRTAEPGWAERDRFILSQGPGSAGLYTVLAQRGFFPLQELHSFRDLNSRLQGHPCMNKTPGVDMSTGALGHGLSVGLGMALAARVQGKSYWTYVMVGEGCLNEGQSWEALMAAAKYRPERLVAMVDYNKVQLDGRGSDIMPLESLADKLKAFGWNVAPEQYDGHSMAEILRSYAWLDQQERWPVALIYNTIKGKGVSFMQDTHKWHGSPVDDESYKKARPELESRLVELERML
jgi:transketolase